MTQRSISFEEAKQAFSFRFTMEHVPYWARRRREDGTYYAPQYATDKEWYDNTIFSKEPGFYGDKNHCVSTNQSWPLGKSLDKPYSKD